MKNKKSNLTYFEKYSTGIHLTGSYVEKYSISQFDELYGRDVKIKVNRVYSDIDPYGEENWEV